jgi:SAM-dependent methyltransferase
MDHAMSNFVDEVYLREKQYRDSSRLNARYRLHARFSENPNPLHKWLFIKIGEQERLSILDLGCGPGYLWINNIDKIPAKWKIVLSDISSQMLHESRERILRTMDYALMDIQALPFARMRFDVIVASFVLHHILQLEQSISDIRKRLVGDGNLLAVTSGEGHMGELKSWMSTFGIESGIWNAESKFTLQNGTGILSEYFERIEVFEYQDSLCIPSVDPIMDYVISGISDEDVESLQPNLTELRRFLEGYLINNGDIRITKETGVFVAHAG